MDHLVAQLTIDRPLPEIVEFVRRPENHADFDASDMVGRTLTPGPLQFVGDVFTMEMTWTDDEGNETHYRTDNHVTAFDPKRVIEWSPAPEGEQPLGWRWRYEFEPLGPSETLVTETYDWSEAPAEARQRYGIPGFTKMDLEASLDLLALALVASREQQSRAGL